MGTKRVGLARVEALIENLKRELTLTTATLSAKGFQPVAQAVTAAASAADAVIDAGTQFVSVTSGNGDHIVQLPAPVVGNMIYIHVGANGCELRTSTPASISINAGSGAGAESALPANSLTICICVSSTAWVAYEVASNGTVSATEAAA